MDYCFASQFVNRSHTYLLVFFYVKKKKKNEDHNYEMSSGRCYLMYYDWTLLRESGKMTGLCTTSRFLTPLCLFGSAYFHNADTQLTDRILPPQIKDKIMLQLRQKPSTKEETPLAAKE